VSANLALLRHVSYVSLLGLMSGNGVQVRRSVVYHIEGWRLRSVGAILGCRGRPILVVVTRCWRVALGLLLGLFWVARVRSAGVTSCWPLPRCLGQ
jgi:hypothetical protein